MSSRVSHRLNVHAVKTETFHLGDDLAQFVSDSVPRELRKSGLVIAVTSKIVALSEKAVIARSGVTSKKELIEQEADQYLGETLHGCHLTIKHGLLIPSAGIDESNCEGDYYILYPKNPITSARTLWVALRKNWGVERLGVVMTDSHTTPLRKGVTGIALAYFGFSGIRSCIGDPDLFGRELRVTTVNVADSLAAAAVYVMGEASERSPLAVIETDRLEFTDEDRSAEVVIPPEEDLYSPLLAPILKKKT